MCTPHPSHRSAPRPACFKAYDVRGRIGIELTPALAFRIGTAVARTLRPQAIVLGFDCRESSRELHDALAEGLMSMGVRVLSIGLAGTEEVYFATAHLEADGGIEVTASHNPIDYNGMKFVARGSRPLSDEEFDEIARLSAGLAETRKDHRGTLASVDIRPAYAAHVAGFVDAKLIGPLKIVANAGNGAAGPAFDAIAARLTEAGAKLEIIRINHTPDGTFPKGIPNPLLPENRPATSDPVIAHGADLGIAWDGDFDRCFFFDRQGAFIDGQYIVALLASAFLRKAPGESIVHDPRVVWNTVEQIEECQGRAVMARTGHAHVKRAMRREGAIYGGEMSAHHYFRDFMYCDSGMVPWLLIAELMGRTGKSLGELVEHMAARFPSSGERNFTVGDPASVIARVRETFAPGAVSIDEIDGLSIAHADWRLNLRSSSTEPLLRLNVETRADRELLSEVVSRLEHLILSTDSDFHLAVTGVTADEVPSGRAHSQGTTAARICSGEFS